MDFSIMIKEYRELFNTSYVPDDALKKIRDYANNHVRAGSYNINARMNGKTGYWEMSFNHVEPLNSIPPELRFPYKQKKKTFRQNIIEELPADNEDESDQK